MINMLKSIKFLTEPMTQKYGLRSIVVNMEKKKFKELVEKVLKEDRELLKRLASR